MTPITDLEYFTRQEALRLIEQRYEQRENTKTARRNSFTAAQERFYLTVEPILRKEAIHA
jgi:hypothetical protein